MAATKESASGSYAAPRVAFATPEETAGAAAAALSEEGVVVITGVYDAAQCGRLRTNVLESFEALGTGFEARRPWETWRDERLPVQSRRGMFQCLMSGAPPVREVRTDPRLAALWQAIHKELGHGDIELLCSNDGINVTPPLAAAALPAKPPRDWPHTDAMYGMESDGSIQGQMVLNGSQAVLRATPKSHKMWEWTCERLMTETDRKTARGGWHKLNKAKIESLQAAMTERFGEVAWQVPIYAPEGSLVLWFSSTIHSSTGYVANPPPPAAIAGSAIPDADPLRDWRFVIYVCFFPLSVYDERDGGRDAVRQRSQQALELNRTTPHSTAKLFPPVGRTYERRGKIRYVDRVVELMKSPSDALELWASFDFTQ